MEESKIHEAKCIYSRNSRSLYKIDLKRQELIIKCIKIKHKLTRGEAIKEWFLLKICSVLRVGPHISGYLGFDLIMHQDCVEFAMEACELIHR
jgi:hypothetical protein